MEHFYKKKTLGLWIVLIFLGFPALAQVTPPPPQSSDAPQVIGPEAVRILKLTFAGDMMAHTINWKVGPYERAHEQVQSILKADDLSFVNLETPVDDDAPYANYPSFNVHSDYVWPAITAGFDVFSLANNHSYDRGAKGTRQTWKAMEALRLKAADELGREIRHSGLRAPGEKAAEPWRVEIIECQGFTIGFLACSDLMNTRPDTSIYYATLAKAGERKALLDLVKSLDSRVDFLILSLHTGVEYSRSIAPWFRTMAEDLVANGVDILWSHHPHVLQPWYTLPGPDAQPRLVMPSMGNYLSGQTWYLKPNEFAVDRAWTGDSALMQVELSLDMSQSPRQVRLSKVQPVLTGNYREPDGAVVVWPYTELVSRTRGSWKQFYQERYRRLRDFFPGVAAEPAVPVAGE